METNTNKINKTKDISTLLKIILGNRWRKMVLAIISWLKV